MQLAALRTEPGICCEPKVQVGPSSWSQIYQCPQIPVGDGSLIRMSSGTDPGSREGTRDRPAEAWRRSAVRPSSRTSLRGRGGG